MEKKTKSEEHTHKLGPLLVASYTWRYNPYKWLYKMVTGVVTPISGVMGPYL